MIILHKKVSKAVKRICALIMAIVVILIGCSFMKQKTYCETLFQSEYVRIDKSEADRLLDENFKLSHEIMLLNDDLGRRLGDYYNDWVCSKISDQQRDSKEFIAVNEYNMQAKELNKRINDNWILIFHKK